MNPQTHFLLPFFLSAILAKMGLISWKLALLSGFMGVMIDIDHYIEHIIYAKTNRFSLVKTWNESIKWHHFYQRSFIHEGLGVLIVTIILLVKAIFVWHLALASAISYYSHLLLDKIHLHKEKYWRGKILFLFLKESYFEITLDVVLVLGILIVLLLSI